jgi:hypothetical protein
MPVARWSSVNEVRQLFNGSKLVIPVAPVRLSGKLGQPLQRLQAGDAGGALDSSDSFVALQWLQARDAGGAGEVQRTEVRQAR